MFLDSVQATEEWVQAQIPEIVKTAVNTINQVGDTATPPADADMEALAQAHVNILAGACLSIGIWNKWIIRNLDKCISLFIWHLHFRNI